VPKIDFVFKTLAVLIEVADKFTLASKKNL